MQQQQQHMLARAAQAANRCARSGGSTARSKPRRAAADSAAASPASLTCANLKPGPAAPQHASRISCRGTPSRSGNTVRRLSCRSTRSHKRALQRRAIQRARQPHRKRDRVGRSRALPDGPGTTAGAAQTTAAAPPDAAAPAAAAAPQTPPHKPRQRRNARRLEQAADRELDIQARADPADQPRRQQRMTAQLEEVVVDPDPLDAQHLGKQRAQHLLLRRARHHASPDRVSSGAGSARRSSLPFGVSGRRSRTTSADGTM